MLVLLHRQSNKKKKKPLRCKYEVSLSDILHKAKGEIREKENTMLFIHSSVFTAAAAAAAAALAVFITTAVTVVELVNSPGVRMSLLLQFIDTPEALLHALLSMYNKLAGSLFSTALATRDARSCLKK